MVAAFTMLREASAIAERMDVEDIPDRQVKATLQRTVQALTRHRDLYFADAPEDRPASIIDTPLGAMAYHGGGSPFEVLLDVVEGMPSFIEERAEIARTLRRTPDGTDANGRPDVDRRATRATFELVATRTTKKPPFSVASAAPERMRTSGGRFRRGIAGCRCVSATNAASCPKALRSGGGSRRARDRDPITAWADEVAGVQRVAVPA